MAKEYFIKLSDLINELNIGSEIDSPVEVKHFFSGAALYINGMICASWSPVGLAFKLSENETKMLISSGQATPEPKTRSPRTRRNGTCKVSGNAKSRLDHLHIPYHFHRTTR